MLKKVIRFIDNVINKALTLVFVITFLFASYAIYDSFVTYESAELPSVIKKFQPTGTDELKIDDIKNEVNDNIVGWINIFDTSINYPIVQGKDNLEYLNKNYLHEYSTPGSIFLDYRNKNDFEDDFSVIYGHNLINNTMFGGLIKFEKSDYFNKHLDGMLYTSKGNYKISVLAFSILSSDDNVYNMIIKANNHNLEVKDYLIGKAKNKVDISLDENDKLLLLSTCRADSDDNRSTLLVKLSLVD